METTKEMFFRTSFPVEGDGDVVKDDDRAVRILCARRRTLEAVGSFRAQLKSPIMARLIRKSITMMETDETTTAVVVERPTPWVPPLVFIPK